MDALPERVQSGDPFLVLGIERAFDVSDADIRRRQASLLRCFHPDRIAGAPDAVRERCAADAARVNAAASTLLDAARRADALLSLTDPDGRDPPLPPDVLEESLALRMEIEEADDERRRECGREAEARRDGCIAAFAAAWKTDAAQARRARVEWRYWDRMVSAVHERGG